MSASQKKNCQEKDVQFPNPPSDGVACISVNGTQSTNSTMLIAGSWDNNVYCYELQSNGSGGLSNIIKQSQIAHEAPVLCSDIGPDGMTTFSAGCDGQVRMWNPSQGPNSVQVIGKHDQPVRNMKFLPSHNLLVTSSWDKSIRMWDTRQPTAAATLNLAERIYAMDAKGGAIVAGTAGKQLAVYNISNLGAPVAEFRSALNYQTRCISIFPDTTGFAMGCIEGRVAVESFSEMQNKIMMQKNPQAYGTKPPSKNFVYKCHRDASNVYSVNSIDFHHYGTFCTAGSDGTFTWWDKEARNRLAGFEMHKGRCPITMVKFSPMGNMMFYSLSYDWSKGAEHNDPKIGNNICMHPVLDSEISPRPKP